MHHWAVNLINTLVLTFFFSRYRYEPRSRLNYRNSIFLVLVFLASFGLIFHLFPTSDDISIRNCSDSDDEDDNIGDEEDQTSHGEMAGNDGNELVPSGDMMVRSEWVLWIIIFLCVHISFGKIFLHLLTRERKKILLLCHRIRSISYPNFLPRLSVYRHTDFMRSLPFSKSQHRCLHSIFLVSLPQESCLLRLFASSKNWWKTISSIITC